MFEKIAIIGGARPNFMKIMPLCRELDKSSINYFLINTGQHFSEEMSKVFFDEFGILPDYNLQPKRNSVISQLAEIMTGIEKIFLKQKPDFVFVVGDVNSTLAGALVANKLGIKFGHIEAGLRSFNKAMPEEHNRILTDHISDYLFVTCEDGINNLKQEGISDNVFFVGNIMIDTLKYFLDKVPYIEEGYYFCTIHRKENVDDKKIFKEILTALAEISKDNKIYLPLHPRTKKQADLFGLTKKINKIFKVIPPLSYSECIKYQKNAKLILTDSGGIQEEASFLGVPCITLRTETERPITISLGTNILGGVKQEGILQAYKKFLKGRKNSSEIPFWDGRTSERIVKIIKK